MRKTIVLVVLILACYGLTAGAPLSPAETGQLVEMLAVAGFDSLSLNFEKDWDLSTKYKMDWQLRQLQEPWRALEDLAELREYCALSDSLPQNYTSLLQRLGGIAFNLDPDDYAGQYDFFNYNYGRQFRERIRKPEDLFGWLEDNLGDLAEDMAQAYAGFSRKDLERLESFWMWQFIEREDVEAYERHYHKTGLPDYDSLDVPHLRERMGDIDLAALLEAGIRFQALADALADNADHLKYRHKSPLIRKTPLGLMVIGSTGDDVYNSQTLPDNRSVFCSSPAAMTSMRPGSGLTARRPFTSWSTWPAMTAFAPKRRRQCFAAYTVAVIQPTCPATIPTRPGITPSPASWASICTGI
ncbi:MAG TPA: hypothetical protein PKH19_00015 [Candidatus Syntrophosphaera sp.]|nr:hypothetical protein [Candidatus Syntrophosphaera sp.]